MAIEASEIREIVVRIITESAESIQAEYERTANSWAACFGSRVFAIETTLSMRNAPSAFDEPGYPEIIKRLEELKDSLDSTKKSYPEHLPLPPEKTMSELLSKLIGLLAP